MRPPENEQYLLFGGTFVLANKLQLVGDKLVDGLSTKQWFLLRNLMDFPKDSPPTLTGLAKEMNSTRQNITKMLEAMVREGLVTIEDCGEDHRSRVVSITETGLIKAKETAENAQGFLERLFEDISQEKCLAAGKVLIKMMENLQKIEESLS